jgi:hypothetical protein
MGNKIVKTGVPTGHFIAAEFLQNKIWNDGYKLVISNPELEDKVKKICNLSTKQVSRVDKNLTKTDLIAILIKLNPIYKIHYDDMYKYLSFKDLNYIIRHEVYNNSISHIFKNELK